jgi:hypothetical protein
MDRRSELQPRVPHPSCRAADSGRLGAAAGPDRLDLLPTARPLEAAVGDVVDRGPPGRSFRADLKEPPRADRRDRRDRSGDCAVRPLSGPAATAALRACVAAALRAGRRRALGRRSAGRRADRARARRGRARRALAPRSRACPRARGGRGHRRDRLGRSEPGAGDAFERRHRPAPALCRGGELTTGLQARQERLRRDRQRCRAGCGRRARF